jgi:hypothetical protein
MYHRHPEFINRHTAMAVLMLVVGCFFAGYYVGKVTEARKYEMLDASPTAAEQNTTPPVQVHPSKDSSSGGEVIYGGY